MVEVKKKPKFLRKDWNKKPKLGKGVKKNQKWVRPRGRHNKLREKKKGHAKAPGIGFSQAKEIRGKVENLNPVNVRNIKDVMKINKKEEIAIFSSVGMKNKIEMAKKAKELGIKTNVNIHKLIKQSERKIKIRKENRKKKAVEIVKKAESSKKKAEKSVEKKDTTKEDKDKMMKKPVEKEQHNVVAPKENIIKRKALEK